VKDKNKLITGETRSYKCNEMVVVELIDNRNMSMLSTKLMEMRKFDKKVKNTSLQINFLLTVHRGKSKEKPEIVTMYNKFMLGVDKLDQLMTYYSF
jgi:hypothetical protein